jgi:hypothetical protein
MKYLLITLVVTTLVFNWSCKKNNSNALQKPDTSICGVYKGFIHHYDVIVNSGDPSQYIVVADTIYPDVLTIKNMGTDTFSISYRWSPSMNYQWKYDTTNSYYWGTAHGQVYKSLNYSAVTDSIGEYYCAAPDATEYWFFSGKKQ